jgi:hypothetical protein
MLKPFITIKIDSSSKIITIKLSCPANDEQPAALMVDLGVIAGDMQGSGMLPSPQAPSTGLALCPSGFTRPAQP